MCFSFLKKESEFSNKVKVAVESALKEIQARNQIHTIMWNVTIVQVVIENDVCVTMIKRDLLSSFLCSVHINTLMK